MNPIHHQALKTFGSLEMGRDTAAGYRAVGGVRRYGLILDPGASMGLIGRKFAARACVLD